MSVITVENLTKDYGSGRGVFGINLNVERGEVFGFLGPNGAGKSTTIRHLMGFSKPDSGNTYIFGEPSFQKYYDFMQKVGYIPGEIALPQGLTGKQFIEMMQNLQKIKNQARLNEMLDMFELSSSALAGETKRMSLGVKRKLAVVTAFMHDPEVLVLDEPTSGLDPLMQERFVQFIHEEKSRGKTILLSSHIFTEIDSTCDRIAIIKDGRIVSEFIADDLRHASTKFYSLTFETEKLAESFLKEAVKTKSFKLLSRDGSSMQVSFSDDDLNAIVKLLSSFNATDFSNRRESLEDYFMKFYKEDKDFKGALK